MATCSKIPSFRMLLFFIFFITVSVIQCVATSRSTPLVPVLYGDDSKTNRTFASDTEFRLQKLSSKEERKKKDSKREMIGSVAPTCTFNECRGCKYNKCRAEQVPVEGNDPMNSPYHYKCVCHR